MIKLRSNLKKEDIALSKGYMRWYRVVGDEIRLFVNERAVNENEGLLNKIDYKKNTAELCIDGLEYATKFYEDHKQLKIKFFAKPDGVALYSEYEVKDWGLNEKGIEIIFA
ncbi:MAG TPA: hypothetical protein VIK34_05190 [Clostridiaceae bacterium]